MVAVCNRTVVSRRRSVDRPMYRMRRRHRTAPSRRPRPAGSPPAAPGLSRVSRPAVGDRAAGGTASTDPLARAGPPPCGAWAHRGSECALKYNCPLPPDDLPWTYDDMADTDTSRVHKPVLAARGCPDRSWGWSGCCVSAKRHLPVTAPGNSPRGGFHLRGFSYA